MFKMSKDIYQLETVRSFHFLGDKYEILLKAGWLGVQSTLLSLVMIKPKVIQQVATKQA